MPDPYDDFIRDYSARKVDEEADKQGVDRGFARKIAGIESSGRADVITGKKLSSAGARGTMQLMPGTAKEMGVDPHSIEGNIQGGVKYAKRQLDTFKDPVLAAAAYNAGPGAVKKYGGVPPYKETRKYANQFKETPQSSAQSDPYEDFLQQQSTPTTPAQPSTRLAKPNPKSQPTAPSPQPADPLIAVGHDNKPGLSGLDIVRHGVQAQKGQAPLQRRARQQTQAAKVDREWQNYENRSLLGKGAQAVTEGFLQGADQLANIGNKVYGGLGAIGGGEYEEPIPRLSEAAKEDLATKAQANDALGTQVLRGVGQAIPTLPAYIGAGAAAGPAGIAGLSALQEDWKDPLESAANVVLNTAVPLGAGKLVGAAARPLIQRAASPLARTAANIGAEAVGGAAGNTGTALASGVTDPRELTAQALIGAATSAPFGAKSIPEYQAARRRPAGGDRGTPRSVPEPPVSNVDPANAQGPVVETPSTFPKMMGPPARRVPSMKSTTVTPIPSPEQARADLAEVTKQARTNPQAAAEIGDYKALAQAQGPGQLPDAAIAESAARAEARQAQRQAAIGSRGRGAVGTPNIPEGVAPTPQTDPQLAQGMYGARRRPPAEISTPQMAETTAPNVPRRRPVPLAEKPPEMPASPRRETIATADTLPDRAIPALPRPRPVVEQPSAPPIDRAPEVPVEQAPRRRPVYPEPVVEPRSRPPVETAESLLKKSGENLHKPEPVKADVNEPLLTPAQMDYQRGLIERATPDKIDLYIKTLERQMAGKADTSPDWQFKKDLLDQANARRVEMRKAGEVQPKYERLEGPIDYIKKAIRADDIVQPYPEQVRRLDERKARKAARMAETVPQMEQQKVTQEPASVKESPKTDTYATHQDFGPVTLAESQSGVGRGKVRVTGEDGAEHIINKRGRNQRAIISKSQPQEPGGNVAAMKEPWQMTLDELNRTGYIGYDTATRRAAVRPSTSKAERGINESEHARAVATAVKEDKPVPAEVLADYPDLQKERGAETGTATPEPVEPSISEAPTPAPASKQSMPERDTGWLGSVPEHNRERVLMAMRQIDNRVQGNRQRSKSLSPTQGMIGVGNNDIMPRLQADAMSTFLREINKGSTPDTALDVAKAEARQLIKSWNERESKGRMAVKRKSELHHWEGALDAELESAWRTLRQDSERAAPAAPEQATPSTTKAVGESVPQAKPTDQGPLKYGDPVTINEGGMKIKGSVVERLRNGQVKVRDDAGEVQTYRPEQISRRGEQQSSALRVPDNLRSKAVGRDISDEGKVNVRDLGLESKFAGSLPGQTKTTNKNINIDNITLGRDDLSKGRMLQVEQALSKGIDPKISQSQGADAITVVEDPKAPGKYIVDQGGNHRIALLKLAGFKGEVPVRATERVGRRGRISVGPIEESKGGTVLGAGLGGLQGGFRRTPQKPSVQPSARLQARGAVQGGVQKPANRGRQPQTAQQYFDNVIAKELAPKKESGINPRLTQEAHQVLRDTAMRHDKGSINDDQAARVILAADELMSAAKLGDQSAIREARAELRKAQNAGSFARQTGSVIKRIGETSRTSVFGGDLSIPLRQAWPLTAGIQNWPRAAATAKNALFKALMSEGGAEKVRETIQGHESFDRAQKANLEMTSFGEGEETFQGIGPIEKIPVIGKLYKRTQDANEAYLDSLRLQFFDREVKKLDKKNLSPSESQRQEKAIAEAVNTMTGRTDLGEGKFRDLVQALQGTIMTAPRLNVSRAQLINPVKYIQLARQSPRAAKLMAQETGSAVATVVGLGLLGTAAGVGRFVTDRKDPDFGKFRTGKVAKDMSGGLLPQVKLALEISDYLMAEGKNLAAPTEQTKKEISNERRQMISRGKSYLRTRETPLAGLAHDTMFEGKDFEGNELSLRKMLTDPKTMGRVAYGAYGPAFAADLYKGFSEGAGTGAMMLDTVLGGGNTLVTAKMERARQQKTATRPRRRRL